MSYRRSFAQESLAVATPSCPSCGSQALSRNGQTRHGKQNYNRRACGRQFVLAPVWQAMPPAQDDLIEGLLLERVSLARLARV